MRKASSIALLIGILATIAALIYPFVKPSSALPVPVPVISSSPPLVPTSTPKAERKFPEPKPGQIFATLTIPRLHRSWPIIEGTSTKNLAKAPAHYEGSQMPGEAGNFSIAAHRTRDYFWYLDKLRPGDDIVITVYASTVHYKVRKSFTVLPTDVSVVSANPDNPSLSPAKHYITLTTCDPKWGWNSSSSSHRLIVRGEEV